MPSQSAPTDTWSLRPGIASLAIIALLALLCQIPGSLSFFLIPVSLLGFVIVAATVLALAIRHLVMRHPRKAGSLVLVVLLPIVLWQPLIRLAALAHLGLTVCCGIGGRPVQTDANGYALYDWSVGLAGGPNTMLIRDPSDQIALPSSQRTALLPSDGILEECVGKTTHVAGHYYVCTF